MIIPDLNDVWGKFGVDASADERQQVAPKEHLDDPNPSFEVGYVCVNSVRRGVGGQAEQGAHQPCVRNNQSRKMDSTAHNGGRCMCVSGARERSFRHYLAETFL
jgi:hypothetical protein